MIDPHVHCRDGNQAYKDTVKHVLEVAREQGIEKIFDMPNTDPPVLLEKDVNERLRLVPKDRKGDYFLYIGATWSDKQLEDAVMCYNKYREVIGIKLFAGKSVGDLEIIKVEEQRKVYGILTDLGYEGVLAVHCEKKDYLEKGLWDPTRPITHSYARPKKAEIESIKDQIELVEETGFKGILHICHVSCPESVELVRGAKMTCGVTPHHILWSNEMLERPDGLLYKMNPPLRNMDDVLKLRELLKQGKIDWIETDHASHAIGEKLFSPFMSGFPSLYLYKSFITEFLPSIGIGEDQIRKLTSENIYRTFENKLK